MSGSQLFRQTVLPSWIACAPMLFVLAVFAAVPVLDLGNHWIKLLTHGPAAALVGAVGTWFWAFNDGERTGLRHKFQSVRLGGRNELAATRAPAA
jgi:hypothetical protein